jgi:hypothetical protein
MSVERAASLEDSIWLPAYGWWPPAEEFSLTVIVSPYHVAVEPSAELRFILRGYAGSPDPVFERDFGTIQYGRQSAVCLDSLDLPAPGPDGGILEVHVMRLDAQPRRGSGFAGMWIDARGRDGGGYQIPTIPIRGAVKTIARDDLQVIPGVIASKKVSTELLMLNPLDVPNSARFVVSSPDGLRVEGRTVEIGPWSLWRGSLTSAVPRSRTLLRTAGDGTGSLAIYSRLRLLPYFGFRRGEGPLASLDHAAPIFAV